MTLGGNDAVWRKLGQALENGRLGLGNYPNLATAHPVFLVVEQAGPRWRILGPANPTPQEARDELAHQFLVRASQADPGGHDERGYREAADLLDRERRDEMRVAGGRFRIVRAEQVVRMGADGPEPPRPADTDRPGAGQVRARPEFLGDADTDFGPEAAALKAAAGEAVTKAGGLPPENIADERRAIRAYPRVVLLGTWFTIGEQTRGRWKPFMVAEHRTPAEARGTLVHYFRDYAPRFEKPGPEVCAAYAAAADSVERDQLDEITVAGRRFRITRIERMVRMRGNIPEPPRPSDFDPYPPPAVQAAETPDS